MSERMPVVVRTLTRDDVEQFRELLAVMGEAFGEVEMYTAAQPGTAYLRKLLGGDQLIALAAVAEDAVIGGLVAYELPKFEQARSEIYIYDLAVAAAHRRQGVATALIEELRAIGKARGAYVILCRPILRMRPPWRSTTSSAHARASFTSTSRWTELRLRLHLCMPIMANPRSRSAARRRFREPSRSASGKPARRKAALSVAAATS